MKDFQDYAQGDFLRPEDLAGASHLVQIHSFEEVRGQYGDQLVMLLHSGKRVGLNKTTCTDLAGIFGSRRNAEDCYVVMRAEQTVVNGQPRLMIRFAPAPADNRGPAQQPAQGWGGSPGQDARPTRNPPPAPQPPPEQPPAHPGGPPGPGSHGGPGGAPAAPEGHVPF